MTNLIEQQEYKGTARALIYGVDMKNNIGYIYITLHRRELEQLFLNTENILKHDEQKNFSIVTEKNIDLLKNKGGLPGGKIENPSYKLGQATKGEKIETIRKEIKEEMGLTLNEDFKLLSSSRDQNKRKETYEYKGFLDKNKIIEKTRYEENKERIKEKLTMQENDHIYKFKVPGLLTEGNGEQYNFDLDKNKKRNYINENYQVAYDLNINPNKLQSTTEEAMIEIGGFTKIPVHKIHNNNGEITLETYNTDFADILKFSADKSAYHKIRIVKEIKEDIMNAIKQELTNNK